ncbi:hypothetical protein [Demequina lutea]|uniref:Uncharacterized protein n=1 Tax=Demequina lutea TaxID=431489 RepID=A0A7Z0CGU5_9MICO|nr:hypothetical protein [Demequina lutea]NYI40109.1 hypothetical protein [Demequina lutea]
MNATRALVWASRVLFGLGLVLFAGLFIYMATQSGSGDVTTSGGTVTNVSSGEMKAAVIIFAAIAWSFLAGSGLRTLSQSTSWPRALLSIAELVGFGVIFAAPIYAVSGRDGMAGALACFLSGFAVIIVSKLVAFTSFGAKEAAASVGSEIARAKDIYRQAQDRSAMNAPPASFAPQTFMPSAQTFAPEPPSQEPPGSSSPAR